MQRFNGTIQYDVNFGGGSSMISKGIRFDKITVLTRRIRKERPELKVKTQIRRHRTRSLIKIYPVCHPLSNFTYIQVVKSIVQEKYNLKSKGWGGAGGGGLNIYDKHGIPNL